MNTLKDMVSNNKTVSFLYYKDSNLWYKTECDFAFPVPIDDVGTATMLATDKAMLFMRYIWKQLDLVNEAAKAKI